MKNLIYILLFISSVANAQYEKGTIQANFRNIESMPYICGGEFQIGNFGCGDSLFWEVVVQKDLVIKDLIELLDDTTESKAFFPNYGGIMRVADIAEIALGEIIQPLPEPNDFFDIAPMDNSQWMANIRWKQRDYENRVKYRNTLLAWYQGNKLNLVWTTSNTFMCGDVSGEHPNKGHYELKKE